MISFPDSLDRQAIIDAIDARQSEAVSRLMTLVSEGSLLGAEGRAQKIMYDTYEELGLDVREFLIDERRVSQHPAWSPSIVSYDGRPNVVGIHQPNGATRGQSLILNGHIDVVPVGADSLWTHPPFTPFLDGDRL